MSKKEEQTKVKHRDRYTISFRPKKVNKPMNEIINRWIELGESPTDKIVETLIESEKQSYSVQTRKFKNIFTSIYTSLAPVYHDEEELYIAIDEVLGEVLDINLANLFDLIQVKIDEKTAPHLIRPKKEVVEAPKVENKAKDFGYTEQRLEVKQEKIVSEPAPIISKPEPTTQSDHISILVNGVKTEATRTPDKPTKVETPQSEPSSSFDSDSSNETDFFGAAGIDFFSTTTI